jgi:hypothetical protein
LVDLSDGRADVFEFFIDAVTDLGQSDDHTNDGDCLDENQFSGNDKSGFVLVQSGQDAGHGESPRSG